MNNHAGCQTLITTGRAPGLDQSRGGTETELEISDHEVTASFLETSTMLFCLSLLFPFPFFLSLFSFLLFCLCRHLFFPWHTRVTFQVLRVTFSCLWFIKNQLSCRQPSTLKDRECKGVLTSAGREQCGVHAAARGF